MKTIAQRLQEALQIRDMKQVDISKATGIPKGSISQYVSGYVEPKQDRIYLLAKALNVQEAWLLGFDVEMNRTENANLSLFPEDVSVRKELIDIIDAMNNDQLNMLLGMAKVLVQSEGE